ncbi:MAG: hypothetical protein JWN46_2749 [Acidimicrobiales bacterium]|nr:hypothetical protein [Acidimicrobiales bacterium]
MSFVKRVSSAVKASYWVIGLMVATVVVLAAPTAAQASPLPIMHWGWNQSSTWWSGSIQVSQGYGCTYVPHEPYPPSWKGSCPSSAPRFHSGIDIGMGCNTTIVTPVPVVVVAIGGITATGARYSGGIDGGAGSGFGPYYPTLRLPDGHDVILGHVNKTLATRGQTVAAGQPIAVSGTQGNSSGCHLHFEVRAGGGGLFSDVDPTPFLTLANTPPPPPSHPIVNQAHGLCLDAAAQTVWNDGGIVQLWSCVGASQHNQQWYSVGNEIRNLMDGKCLDADWGGDGSYGGKVQMWSCNNGPNQQWVLNGSGQYVNQAHGLCLDADWGGDGTNGGKVQLWGCNSGPNQKWVPPSGPTSYTYHVVAPGGSLNERSAPSTSATYEGTLPNGATINIVCQTSGSSLNGSSIWDRLTNGYYVSDYYTSTPNFATWSPPIPHC